MAIVVLPQKQPTQNQTGIGQFVQGLNPMLQAAFAQALQNKAYQFQLQKQMEMKQQQAEQDRQNTLKTLEQYGAYSRTPETQSFMQPSAGYPQGINLPVPGKFKESFDLSKLPEGLKIGTGGEMSFQAPDPFSQYYRARVAEMTGNTSIDQTGETTPSIPDMGITGLSLGKGGGRLTFGQTPEMKLKSEGAKNLQEYSSNALDVLVALDTVEQYAKKLPKFERGFLGQTKARAGVALGEYTADPKFSQYSGILSQKLTPLARKLQEEKGPITEFDIDRVVEGLGNKNLPIEDKVVIMNEARNLVKEALTNKIRNAGMTVEQFAQQNPELYKKAFGAGGSAQTTDGMSDEQAYQEYLKMTTGGF